MSSTNPGRKNSYGQNRRFVGLEDMAIRKRLERAQALIRRIRAEQPDKALRVLELGCGYWGRNLGELCRSNPGGEFTGVDLSVAEQVEGFRLVQGDITNWMPKETYDVVLSLSVVEHLIEPQKHFNLMASALAAGGLAGLTTPTPAADALLSALSRSRIFDREEISDHKLYLTEAGLRLCAQLAGLEVMEYEHFSFGMNQWVLMRKK